jgi:hypothetical protein
MIESAMEQLLKENELNKINKFNENLTDEINIVDKIQFNLNE